MIKHQEELIRIIETGMANCSQRALCVALKKRLFDQIGENGASIREIGKILGCADRPARIMAFILAALGLLRKEGEYLFNTPGSLLYLNSGREEYVGDFILMLDERLYEAWSRLEETVSGNAPQDSFGDVTRLTGEEIADYIHRAMMGLHGVTTVTSNALAEVIFLKSGTVHLDLGGGTGALCIALARKFSDASFILMDRQQVLSVAMENIEKAGLSSRILALNRDFFDDPYPEGISSISISNVLQDWPREKKNRLLKRSFDALPHGGMIIVLECTFEDNHNGPLLTAQISLNMLIETAGGENYSAAEISQLLSETGFESISIIRNIWPFGIILGSKR